MPVPDEKRPAVSRTSENMILSAIGAIVAVAIVVVISETLPEFRIEDQHPYFGKEMLVGTAFLDAVKRRIPDPANAEFKDVKVYLTDDGGGAVCGLVKAKSASGTAAGFEAFLASSKQVTFRSDVASDTEFQALAQRVCRQASVVPRTRPTSNPPSSQ
jgi:hypothetical protein